MFLHKSRSRPIVILTVIALFIATRALSVPLLLNYQGKLTDPNTGQPIPDGNHALIFDIYDAQVGGSLVGGPYPSNVTTQDGLFNAEVGPIDPSVFDGSDRFLEISVDGETLPDRQKVVSVAYAIRSMSAADADTLSGQMASAFATSGHTHAGSDGHSLDAADGDPVDSVFVNNDGNVRVASGRWLGIGTSPSQPLHLRAVSPVFRIDDTSTTGTRSVVDIGFGDSGTTQTLFFIFNTPSGDSELEVMRLQENGRVGIGTPTPQSTLAVNGTITAQEVVVTLSGWPDFVFEEDYPLMPLNEVEQHIKQHKHLPDIPSETAVSDNGVSLGEMQAKLLQKVEELTLYMIEQDKRIEKLEQENQALRVRVSSLEGN